MAYCKQSAQEFIQNAFSPCVTVLCSDDAEAVCMKNNLSFVDLIQPFCRLTTEAHIRDAGGMAHSIHNLRVSMRDFNAAIPQPTMARKLTSEAVASTQPLAENIARANFVTIGDYDLQLSQSTPWFEAYRNCFLNVLAASEHEFLRHYLACVFVVSSAHPDPLDQYGRLTLQHQQMAASRQPKPFSPNILKYYVLIHDVTEGEESKAEAVYQSMKTTYSTNCHLLQINSRQVVENMSAEVKENLPDPWSQFMSRKVNNSLDVSELDSDLQSDNAAFPSQLSEGTRSNSIPRIDSMADLGSNNPPAETVPVAATVNGQAAITIDHPLALNNDSSTVDEPQTITANSIQVPNNVRQPVSKLTQFNTSQHGAFLTVSDHDRLKIFVHEFIVRGLIPWCEKTMRTLTELIQSKKTVGRSLFSATKKWFGGNKPAEKTIQQSTNTTYPTDSPEMQMRRLADLAFMFHMYEVAYQTYHAVKRDFNNEHAWLYLAGALEMACLSVFMQGANTQRQCPHHYMESAISTYLQSCKAPQFAARAVLMSTEALKSRGMYAEAAMQLIKLTSEESDLRSALLLEQAAHCFLNMKTPMVRKYAFHMILAGHRFSKASQRKHSLRAYSQALQVYKGKQWTLAEDHINFTIGRQSFNLKQLENATSALRHVLNRESQQSIAQQYAFLREYLFVFKHQLTCSATEGNMVNGVLPQLPLPTIDGNATKVLLCKPTWTPKDNVTPATSASFSDDDDDSSEGGHDWEDLEDILVQQKYGGSLPLSYAPTVQCYTAKTCNSSNPRVVLGEPVTVQIALVNPLKIPLVLTEVHLLWTYCAETTGDKPGYPVTNEVDTIKNSIADELVHTEVIEEIMLAGSERKLVNLTLTPRHTGELHVVGVAYNLGTTSHTQPYPVGTTAADVMRKPGYVSAIYVRGKQNLEVQGPRLNSNKTEKSSRFYGLDRRLDFVIVPSMPRLEVNFYDFPQALLCGEVQKVTVELTNHGPVPLTQLKVASSSSSLFTFGASNKPTDNSLTYVTIPESDSNEYVIPDHKVSSVCLVPVPNGQLQPGQSASVPMWLRGDATPGLHDINFLFYYESTEPKPGLRHRVLRHRSKIITTNSLELKATAYLVCDQGVIERSGRGEPSSVVLALEVHSLDQLHNSSITEFSILQMSAASRQWCIDHLSTSRETDIKINDGESMLLCLKGTKCKRNLNDWDKQVVFSNVSYDQHIIDSTATPCADFYFRHMSKSSRDVAIIPRNTSESSLRFPDKVENSDDNLDKALDIDFTVIALWKGFVVNENGVSQVIVGQHHLTVNRLETQTLSSAKHKKAIESGPLRIIKDPVDTSKKQEAQLKNLEKFVNANVRCSPQVSHNFSKNRLCHVPIHVILENCSQSQLQVKVQLGHHSDCTEPAVTHLDKFSWCGQVSRRIVLDSKESRTLEFRASFCRPGVYNLGSVHVTAGVMADDQSRTMELVRQTHLYPTLISITKQ